MDNLIQKSQEISHKINEMKAAIAEEMRQELHVEFQNIFENNPKLDWFSWSQYTPYFNDGDACIFSVNDYVRYSWDGEEHDAISNWNLGYILGERESPWRKEPYPQNEKDAAIALQPILEMLNVVYDDIFLDIFGDHAEITVSRSGITVGEYDHD